MFKLSQDGILTIITNLLVTKDIRHKKNLEKNSIVFLFFIFKNIFVFFLLCSSLVVFFFLYFFSYSFLLFFSKKQKMTTRSSYLHLIIIKGMMVG
jgi:hypothetical protein